MWKEIESLEDFPKDGSICICYDVISKKVFLLTYDYEEDLFTIVGMEGLDMDCVPTHILELDSFPTENDDE